ncbi:hypothetical protein Bpfe_001611 [Biomphalaria pfeifferi]|uniref:Uncharacterized protein n=1 Tax=Biomphalaria pfeifferi TaxID=112525 RepID=A0AAD8CA59_BIOPF|nr:hypothetical protein Bpfe_001611 [Biomphalaria pfeifferi]
MNTSEWLANSTSVYLSLINPDDHVTDKPSNTTVGPSSEISDKPCGEALSSQTPAAVKLPGSLDALLYIVIVLMFYAFSIVVLMVKYIRREREEASLRNYYNEFVSRDKFRSAQYKNRQFMKRIFGRGRSAENSGQGVREERVNTPIPSRGRRKTRSEGNTIIRNGNTFNRLLLESDEPDEKRSKESFTFLSAKNQFCKKGFFGKKFCNKQLCSKCVTEGAPTIDWGDGKGELGNSAPSRQETVEIRVYNNAGPSSSSNMGGVSSSSSKRCYLLERDNSIFFPIMECDSERDSEDAIKPLNMQPLSQHWGSSEEMVMRGNKYEDQAIVSSCSLEVSELLANMPPLGAFSNSNDMDTLDGLSNLDSEAESQSLLNYSTSMRGTNNMFSSINSGDSPRAKASIVGESPRVKNSGSSDKQGPTFDGTHKDFSDFLSERTSLLSCTLSIANEVDEEDAVTNHSSSKNYPNGFSHSNSNGKIKEERIVANGKLKEELCHNGKLKEELCHNAKSILNSVSKSANGDEEEMMRLLTNITMITEESGLFKNLKYFLRSFSKHENVGCVHEKSNLLPKETFFGPGSPKSVFSTTDCAVVPTKCKPVSKPSDYDELDSVDNDLLNMDELENFGNRWGYAYDEEEDLCSDGGKSSSFGEYCMGEAPESQVIDLSRPLVRRQLDSETRNGLSLAFIGLEDSLHEDVPAKNKTNPLLAGYGSARKETKV